MVVLESKTESQEDLTNALKAVGLTPKVEEPEKAKVEEPKPAVEEPKKSEEAVAPGDKVPVETVDKTAAVTEPAKEKTPEPQENQEAKDKKAIGGFRAKIDTLTRRLDDAKEETAAERKAKADLEQKLEEAKAELARLQPVETKPAELTRPVRPKKTNAAYQTDGYFDEAKYEQGLEEYDDKIATYHQAVTAQEISKAVATEREERAKAEQQVQMERAEKEFFQRRDKSKSVYDDFDDTWKAIPEGSNTLLDASLTARNYISAKSKEPAHLIYFIAKDFLENDGEEGARLAQLDDFDLVIELKAIEDRLIREHAAPPKKEQPKEPVATVETTPAKTPETPPAKSEPQKTEATLGAPIKPVGPRTATDRDNYEKMAERGDSKALIAEFQRKRAERLAGRA